METGIFFPIILFGTCSIQDHSDSIDELNEKQSFLWEKKGMKLQINREHSFN